VKPFFNASNLELLCDVAQSWVGAPFHPNGRTRDGVSCQMFCCELYRETGFLPQEFVCQAGPMDWGNANTSSLIEKFIGSEVADKFEIVESNALPGDLLGFTVGGCLQHLGVKLEDEFIHVLKHRGVILSRFDDASYLKRLCRIWRPVA
jgi:cell wall-associated NlpC family hydrolase